MRTRQLHVALVFLISLASCSSQEKGFTVDETIHFSMSGPQMVTQGNTVQFNVVIENEPGNDKVNWSCTRGTITDRGYYTAPMALGTAQVIAVRKDTGARQTEEFGLMVPPSIAFFRAEPDEIAAGGKATLTFLGSPDVGTVTPGGMLINSFTPVVVTPVTTTTYKVTVCNPDAAKATAEVTVTVK